MAGALVQSAQVFQTSPLSTTLTVTLTNTTAGNAIVAFGHDGNGINRAMTCADNVNGSYGTQVDSLNDSGNGNTIRSWVKGNIAGGTVTVTLTLPAADGFSGLYAGEISGVTTAPLDGHSANGANIANGGTITSNAGTNTNTAFMLALSVQDSSTAGAPSVGAGFTVDPTFSGGLWNNGAVSARVEFKASVAAGSNAAIFTNGLGSTQTFNTLMVMLDESGGSGVTVALIGQAAAFTAGSMAPSSSVALAGQTATFSPGALSPSNSVRVLGQVASFTPGAMAPTNSVPLTGQRGTFTPGTLQPLLSLALTGQSSAFAAGTLLPNLSIPLLGQLGLFTAGNMTVPGNVVVALSGQRAAFVAGTLIPNTSVSISGQRASFSGGTMSVSVSISLMGLSGRFSAGSMTASGGTPPAGIPMPNLIGLNYYMALEVLQNAGIYIPLVVYSFEPSSISVKWAKTNLPGGIVTAQSIAAGLTVQPAQALTLTVSAFPFGSMIDSPPDWKQLQ